MTTIKIKSTDPASQGPFVIIDRADFDPAKHELFEGESLGDTSGDTGDGIPTLQELIASRNQLFARSDELDARELQLNQRSELLDVREAELREQAISNANEAQRLADLAAALEAAKAAAKDAGIDPATMTKAQLQAALDSKGTKYPAAADKAELLALLTAS